MNGYHVGGSQSRGPKTAESRNTHVVVHAHLCEEVEGIKLVILPRTLQFYGPNSDTGTPEGEYIENDAFTLMNLMTNTATLYYPDWT